MSRPAGGIRQRRQNRPIPQPDHIANVDRRQQRPALIDADFRRLALDHLIVNPTHRRHRIEDADVLVDQPVEMP